MTGRGRGHLPQPTASPDARRPTGRAANPRVPFMRDVPPIHERSDRDLVAAIREGDSASEAELFRRHRRRVVLWVAARTGDPYAEDHYSEGFLKVVLPAIRRRRIRDEARVEAFIRTITLRLSLRSWRTKEMQMPEGVPWEEMIEDENDLDEVLREEEIAREEAEILREVLTLDLSAQEQELHRLYWVEGRELKELASEQGMKELALRKRHSRMLIRIRQAMADRMWERLKDRAFSVNATAITSLLQADDLGVLGEAERELLKLRYVVGRSWEEVGQRTGGSEREAAEAMLELLRRLRREI